MLLLKADGLSDDPGWMYELKLDGYRGIAFKRDGKVQLRSRNDKDFAIRSRDGQRCDLQVARDDATGRLQLLR